MTDDIFEAILDPYNSSLQKGKDDGRKAALQAGYNDGYQIGKLKALEIGIELSYMSSISIAILNEMNKDKLEHSIRGDTHGNKMAPQGNLDKKKKRIRDLLSDIESFPKPDIIFKNGNVQDLDKTKSSHTKKVKGESTYSSMNDSGNQFEKNDIAALMQRLRAKFKTILVQLNLNHIRLKDVMEKSIIAATDNNKETPSNDDNQGRIDEW
jgi:hypothetical protein